MCGGYYFSRPIPEDQIAGLLASAWTAKPELRTILDDLIEVVSLVLAALEAWLEIAIRNGAHVRRVLAG